MGPSGAHANEPTAEAAVPLSLWKPKMGREQPGLQQQTWLHHSAIARGLQVPRLVPADYTAMLLRHPKLRAPAQRNPVDAALGAQELPGLQVPGFEPSAILLQAAQMEPEVDVVGPQQAVYAGAAAGGAVALPVDHRPAAAHADLQPTPALSASCRWTSQAEAPMRRVVVLPKEVVAA